MEGQEELSGRQTLDDGPRLASAAATLERGDAVGRYLVIERIGQGGMGVVYAAYDPQLDRKVAIKILHPRLGEDADVDDRQRRLLREAQALAKLSHPNVVAVFDAGIHQVVAPAGASVFVAMEFVAGKTVGRWLAEGRQPWPAVLEVFLAAGRGLAAAHAAGLVHRDMKPDNIMLGDDPKSAHESGRVRVMDFGLARGGSGPSTEARASTDAAPDELWNAELTQRGSTLGTPAYMAPEQHLGLFVDARSDQFSFCIALWEALYGQRPFPGGSLPELALAVTAGTVRDPADSRGVPGWVRRVVERGLAADPERRWPDMPTMLAALADDPTRRRRRTLVVAALVAALALALGVRVLLRARARDACEDDGRSIAQVWSAGPRERLQAALAADGSLLARDTALRVQSWLDAYAQGWQDMRSTACIAAEIDGTMTQELRQRSEACLDERRLALAELVQVLDEPSVDVLRQAVFAAAGLPPLSSCHDEQWLARRLYGPGDDATRTQVAQLRGRLAQASALAQAGRHAAARELVAVARADAVAIGWSPLVAEADLRLGVAASAAGDYAEAERSLHAAYLAAGEAGAEDVAAEAATLLVQVVGTHLARRDAGLMWADQARMMLQRVGEPDDGVRAARLDRALGSLYRSQDEFDEAHDHYARALAVFERELGPDHPDVAMTMAQLGSLADNRGDHEAALAQYQQALGRLERVLGPDHPQCALVYDSIGGIYYARGDYATAVAMRERGLAILERALGPDHPEVAKSLDNLGNVYGAQGNLAQAATLHARALAIFERAHGPDHPDVARSLGNLAAALTDQGKYHEALPHAERALAIFQRVLGNEHRDVAIAFMTLGDLHAKLGDAGKAEASYRQALEVLRHGVGDRHPDVGLVELAIGQLLLVDGRPADAIAPLRHALEVRARELDDPAGADIRFGLAQGLWESNTDRSQALANARVAAELLRARGEDGRADLERVEAWLRAHPG